MDEQAFPKPSMLLKVASVVVILVSLWFAALTLGAAIAIADPCTALGSILILPLVLGLAWSQYRGTFCGIQSAARISSILLYGMGGLLGFAVASAIGEAVVEGAHLSWFWGFLAILAGVAVLAIAFGVWNGRWARELGQIIADDGSPSTRRFSLRELLGAIAVLAVFTATTTYFVKSEPPRWAENVPASEAPMHLPVGASNVSFARIVGASDAYEFDCDEASFREWFDDGIGTYESEAEGVPLIEIRSTISIYRYRQLVPEFDDALLADIKRGLYYRWTEEDRGVYAAFDRETGRGYYYSHSR